MFKEDNNEQFATLTEQGNFGLGIGHIKDEEEKKRVKQQLNNNNQNQNNQSLSFGKKN